MPSFLKKNIPLWKLLAPVLLALIAVAFMADSCSGQTQATIDSESKAAAKWGNLPNTTYAN